MVIIQRFIPSPGNSSSSSSSSRCSVIIFPSRKVGKQQVMLRLKLANIDEEHKHDSKLCRDNEARYHCNDLDCRMATLPMRKACFEQKMEIE
jgi:hypothetical protein